MQCVLSLPSACSVALTTADTSSPPRIGALCAFMLYLSDRLTSDHPLPLVFQIGDSLFLDLPRVRLDGGGKAFRKQWGYDLAPPPTLLEEEEDEDEPEEDDISETQSLREDFFGRQSALGQSPRQAVVHSCAVISQRDISHCHDFLQKS